MEEQGTTLIMVGAVVSRWRKRVRIWGDGGKRDHIARIKEESRKEIKAMRITTKKGCKEEKEGSRKTRQDGF